MMWLDKIGHVDRVQHRLYLYGVAENAPETNSYFKFYFPKICSFLSLKQQAILF